MKLAKLLVMVSLGFSLSGPLQAHQCLDIYSQGLSREVASILLERCLEGSNTHDILRAIRVKMPDEQDNGPVHVIVLGQNFDAAKLRRRFGFKKGGNEDLVLLAQQGSLLDATTAARVRIGQITDFTVRLGAAMLLLHEIVNPGVLPNSLPMVPAIGTAFVAGPLLRNLAALRRRFLDARAKIEFLPSSLAHFIAEFSKTNWIRKLQLRFPLRPSLWQGTQETYIHLIDVGGSEPPSEVVIEGFIAQLESELLLLHPKTEVEISTDLEPLQETETETDNFNDAESWL